MRSGNIVQLGIKELRGLVRNPMMLVLIIYAFTVSIYTASRAQPETLNQAALAIVDEDKSPAATRIITAFSPPYFAVPRLISQSDMMSRMDAGLDTFALNIPPNFQRDLLARRSPAIQLNVDATRMSQAFTGSGYIQSIVGDEVSEFLSRYRSAAPLPIDLALRARFNPELNKSWFGAINNIISSVTMLSIILTGAALIREREHGTIEHLLVMPVTPFEVMASKIWSMGLVVLVAASVSLIFVVQGLLAVRIGGSVPLFLFGTALYLFATTSMGIFLAIVRRHDAAVRSALDAGADAAADVVGRHDAEGEHARADPEHHARRAEHPFCDHGPGHPVPRRRARRRMAAARGIAGDRRTVVLPVPASLPAIPAMRSVGISLRPAGYRPEGGCEHSRPVPQGFV
ncbi:ABC-type multidrug transport system permease subunit [Bradyrhizobium sp. USDA 377]